MSEQRYPETNEQMTRNQQSEAGGRCCANQCEYRGLEEQSNQGTISVRFEGSQTRPQQKSLREYNANSYISARNEQSRRRKNRIIVGVLVAALVVGIGIFAFGAINNVGNQQSADQDIEVQENQLIEQAKSDNRLMVSDSLNFDKPTEHVVYLTFDDGPSSNTDRILSTLKEKGVAATWFIKGNSESLEKVKDIWNGGHQVAIHTYDHNYQSIYASESAFWNDVYKTSDAIEEHLGFTPPMLLRFPGGSFNAFNKNIADRLTDSTSENGWHYFDWNVSCGDGSPNPYTADDIYGFVVAEAEGKNSACVLMHDSAAKDATADALGMIIDYFKAEGYEFKVLTADSYGYHF